MQKRFLGISVVIWDFDGTLYRKLPELSADIRVAEIRVITNHTGWSEKKAEQEFYKIFKKITPSGTNTVSLITGISNAQASIETSQYSLYSKYLQKDPRLIKVFADLQRLKHYMLVNGSQDSVRRGLAALGVDPHIFTEIVTSEIVGETKPSTKGFEYILKQTGLSPSSHLMVGDRTEVDLAPARAMGIQTCLVWDPMPVYDIVDML